MGMLLCLLFALVKVQSQTVPYISFMGVNLLNHSYLDFRLVGDDKDGSDSVQCHTDLITCCSSDQGPDRGDWYFPNRERLQFDTGTLHEVFEEREAQRVHIRHRGHPDPPEGIYCCDILTNAVSNAVSNDSRESVYVGLYASGGEYFCTLTCILYVVCYE